MESRKPLQHRGHSGPSALARASNPPRFDSPTTSPRGLKKKRGRLSNPPHRRLSPNDIADLVDAYQAGATISQLAVEFGIHRTIVAAHLDRRSVPRHRERCV